MPATAHVTDRELTADRLLAASAAHSIDPMTEVDWDQAPVPGAPWACWDQLSLWRTPLWDRMTPEQRLALSRHELASTAGTGLWFEAILMQMLLRHSYDRDPRSAHVRYALTEIADECRHSIMFARLLSTLGTPVYRPPWLLHNTARVFKAISTREVAFAATLVAEEMLDGLQRQVVRDEQVQPLAREVTRLHVVEEARHVRYAREEVRRLWPRLSAWRRPLSQLAVAVVAHRIAWHTVNRDVYAAVGLDPRQARRVARRNPAWRASRLAAAQRVTTFLAAEGVIPRRGPIRWIWRRAWLVA